jgi:hypothetical protein
LPSLLNPTNYNSTIGDYTNLSYSNLTDPTLFTEFTSAAFRIGHSMVLFPFNLMSNDGTITSSLRMQDMFFNNTILNSGSIDSILNGMIRTVSKQRGLEMVDDLRNFLVEP